MRSLGIPLEAPLPVKSTARTNAAQAAGSSLRSPYLCLPITAIGLLAAVLLTVTAMTGCSFEASTVPGSPGGSAPLAPAADPQAGCALACHGDASTGAPPKVNAGNESNADRIVGAHRSHIKQASERFRPVACEDCHLVPEAVDSPLHRDDTDNTAEVPFGPRAKTGMLQPEWNRDAGTCTNVYCHGASLTGGIDTTPTWTDVTNQPLACGSCHGYPPATPDHVGDAADCSRCHTHIRPGANPTTFEDPDKHINGMVEANSDGAYTCTACHGDPIEQQPAPPLALDRNDGMRAGRNVPGVGAHREHLNQGSPAWRRTINCSECHIFPNNVNDPEHMGDGNNRAEITFSNFLESGNALYNPVANQCTSLWCHGDGVRAEGNAVWTEDLPVTCTLCHDDGTESDGKRLSGAHRRHRDENVACSACHTTVLRVMDTRAQGVDISSIAAPQQHIDSEVDTAFADATVWDRNKDECTSSCHRGNPNEKRSWRDVDD